MKRGSVLELRKEKWETIDGLDLEVCVVPGGIVDFVNQSDRLACTRFFVGFKNYTEEDGKAIEDNLANRMELFAVPYVQVQLKNIWARLNDEILLGEGSGASD